jgi:hypothetical protein
MSDLSARIGHQQHEGTDAATYGTILAGAAATIYPAERILADIAVLAPSIAPRVGEIEAGRRIPPDLRIRYPK